MWNRIRIGLSPNWGWGAFWWLGPLSGWSGLRSPCALRWMMRGSRDRGGGSVVKGMDCFQLPIDEIVGPSQIGRVPSPKKNVEEQAARKRSSFLWVAPLIRKQLCLQENGQQNKKTGKKYPLTIRGPILFITCLTVPSSRPCRTWASRSLTRRRIWSAVSLDGIEVVGGCMVVEEVKVGSGVGVGIEKNNMHVI